MTAADWIALLGIALPLFGKVAIDGAAYLTARKHTALANIVGMAGRQAASAARALATIPAGSNAAVYERSLINAATTAVMTEMGASTATVGADSAKVATIVQSELDKLIVAPIPIVPVAPTKVSVVDMPMVQGPAR